MSPGQAQTPIFTQCYMLCNQSIQVQEICANLAMSRLAWVIDFDGSESTTPRLTSENKVTDQNSVAKIDLEEAFALLHHLLLLNSAVFSKTEARDQCENSEKDEDIKFACISEVERRWPKHSSTYKELVKCLIKIKASRSLVKENKTLKAANDDPQTATQATPASDNVISGYNQSAEAHTLESNEEKASEADECKITKAKLIEADAKTKVEMQQSSASPVDNQTVAGIATEAKPTTKPRTISIAQEPSKLIGNDSDMAPPTAHRRQRSLGAAQTQSAVTPRKPTTTVPSASGKPRKKHAAPKPPGPPPNSAGKNLTSKSGTKSANGAPASTTKVVPPRPKPPSVKAKVSSAMLCFHGCSNFWRWSSQKRTVTVADNTSVQWLAIRRILLFYKIDFDLNVYLLFILTLTTTCQESCTSCIFVFSNKTTTQFPNMKSI